MADGYFGIQGVTDAKNLPPGRTARVGWTDLQGNLWIFAGKAKGIKSKFNPGYSSINLKDVFCSWLTLFLQTTQ